MRNRVVLAALLWLSTVVTGVVAPSASAQTDGCFFHGTADVGTPHRYLARDEPRITSSFTIGSISPLCIDTIFFSAWGTLTGWCESTTGWGTTNTGHDFTLTGTAYTFVVAGEAAGAFKFVSKDPGLPCDPETDPGADFDAVFDLVLLD